MRIRVEHIFTGRVQPMPGDGRDTAIFKVAVEGPVTIGSLGIVGDEQADRRVHGGPYKAVHYFPSEHFARLAQLAPEAADALKPGGIGENLSGSGGTEENVCIGDIFAFGSARLQLCQPRSPCWKIDAKFGVDGLTKAIEAAGIAGWYFSVMEEGVARAGDALDLLDRNARPFTLARFWQLRHQVRPDMDELAALASTPGLAPGLRTKLEQRLTWLRKQASRAL